METSCASWTYTIDLFVSNDDKKSLKILFLFIERKSAKNYFRTY